MSDGAIERRDECIRMSVYSVALSIHMRAHDCVSYQHNIPRDLAIEDLERGAFFRINYQMWCVEMKFLTALRAYFGLLEDVNNY